MVVTVDWCVERWKRDERLRFLVAGGWNTLFAYAAFAMLYLLLHSRISYLVIGAFAHVLAVVNAFVVHRLLVFRSSGSWTGEFLRFGIAQGFVFGFGIAALWLLVRFGRLNPLIAQAIISIAAVVISYVAHRRFTFVKR